LKFMDAVIETASSVDHKPTLVVAPVREKSTLGVLGDPLVINMVTPFVIVAGHNAKALCEHALGLGLECMKVSEDDDKKILSLSYDMVLEGDAQILMQGDVSNTIFRDTTLLNPGFSDISRTASHVFILEGGQPRGPFMVTDSMINHAPSLKQKIGILRNALDLSRVLGLVRPKVAALSPIEYVNPGIPSTVDAAVLSRMGDRGQFGDAIIDGPIDIDCAVSPSAAQRKGISSDVIGKVDIYLVPGTEAGSSFVQFLVLLGGMSAAGLITGMKAPCIINTPFVTRSNKVVEIAMAKLLLGLG